MRAAGPHRRVLRRVGRILSKIYLGRAIGVQLALPLRRAKVKPGPTPVGAGYPRPSRPAAHTGYRPRSARVPPSKLPRASRFGQAAPQ